MEGPILVTGAAGRVGGVGRTLTELLLKQGKAVRAMVRNEDERAQTLRDMGAEVVVGANEISEVLRKGMPSPEQLGAWQEHYHEMNRRLYELNAVWVGHRRLPRDVHRYMSMYIST